MDRITSYNINQLNRYLLRFNEKPIASQLIQNEELSGAFFLYTCKRGLDGTRKTDCNSVLDNTREVHVYFLYAAHTTSLQSVQIYYIIIRGVIYTHTFTLDMCVYTMWTTTSSCILFLHEPLSRGDFFLIFVLLISLPKERRALQVNSFLLCDSSLYLYLSL